MKFSTFRDDPENSTTIRSFCTSGIFAPKISTRLRISCRRSDGAQTLISGAVEIHHGLHIDQFAQLFFDLFENRVIPRCHDRHAGKFRIVSPVDGQRLNIVSASAEEAGDPGKGSEFIRHQN